MAKQEIVAAVESERAVKLSSAAATAAWVAVVVAIIALGLSLYAVNRGNTALRHATATRKRVDQLETRINSSLGQSNAASTGAGSGANTQQAVPSTNPTPNGNGQ